MDNQRNLLEVVLVTGLTDSVGNCQGATRESGKHSSTGELAAHSSYAEVDDADYMQVCRQHALQAATSGSS